MSLSARAAALAVTVVSFVGYSAAHAGFIYAPGHTNRVAEAWVSGSSVDAASTTNLGPWYGDAFFNDGTSAVLANQGSNLGDSQMTFAGGAQTSSSVAMDLMGESIATTRFSVTSAGSLNWIVTTNSLANGFENVSEMSVTIVNLTTGQFLFARVGNSSGNGSIQLLSTHTYELNIRAHVSSGSSGSTAATYNAGLEFVAVPTPGTAAMLALAAFTARARRRTA